MKFEMDMNYLFIAKLLWKNIFLVTSITLKHLSSSVISSILDRQSCLTILIL